MQRTTGLIALFAAALALPNGAMAQSQPVLTRDSFPIGDAGGILCQVQDRSVENAAKQTMFDRRWAVVCRDSPQPVGEVYSFRGSLTDAVGPITPNRRFQIDCSESANSAARGWGVVTNDVRLCRVTGTDLRYSIAVVESNGHTYVAEGFTAYDDATVLALRSVLENRVVEGSIDAATTSVADPLSFARVQAETLEPEQALAEGYRRNLGGEFAEAAAYFETLQQRLKSEDEAEINPGEFYVNRALQRSNLGEFAIANRLFGEARPLTTGDPVAGRLQRNYEAIHLLNQGFYPEAIDRLGEALDFATLGASAEAGGLSITLPLSERINQTSSGGALLGFVDELKLTPQERAQIIDAQALQIRGTAMRIEGNVVGARENLISAYAGAIAVRDGRVTSITRMRSQILAELSLIAERQGDRDTAEIYLRNGLAIVEAQYPERRAVSAMQTRLASFLLRNGSRGEAMELYRSVIDRAVGKRNAVTGFANQLNPYYRELVGQVDDDARSADDFFKASQVLVRPGVAETQTVLARELSANSDEAARLFRQANDLGRDIERFRIRFEALGKAQQSSAVLQQRTELADQIERFEQQQFRTQVELNDYPQYRVVSPRSLELAEFRAALKPGEAYARIAMAGRDLFMFYTDSSNARAYRIDLSRSDLDFLVDELRASISQLDGGQYVTYPYNIEVARELHRKLFDPISAELASVTHLIFEPDGALLRLPVDILVSDDASVETYSARQALDNADAYDFTGVNWLGRSRLVSTAVSAQAFVDARLAKKSSASREYLGMGRNTPIGDPTATNVRAVVASGNNACGWNAALWNSPIDDAELITASNIVGPTQSQLITGDAFSDDQIKAKADLQDYRILHFATHGLVTPPDPACAANPALVTSFGQNDSDGLLSFEEIFALDLDADIVILSACDTAGEASIETTRAAGVATGGGTALDGLVRAFIGAGGRAVMASHWPAPDDFDATERLMVEMFRRGETADIGTALRGSQRALMDDPATSHPYYWGGFAVIGDAARPLLSANDNPVTAAAEIDTAEVGQ